MFCNKCGKEIQDGVQFCSYCGASQKKSGKSKSKGWGLALLIVGLLSAFGGYSNGNYADMMVLGLGLADFVSLGLTVGCLFFGASLYFKLQGGNRLLALIISLSLVAVAVGSSKPETTETAGKAPVSTTAPEVKVVETQAQIATTQAQEDGYIDFVPGAWASEMRALGDGGKCGIYETNDTVYNCKRLTLTLQAEGNHGASTKGNWEVHFRMNGQWKHVQTIYYGGSGAESFTISFNPTGTFDAVCAFPTQRGNYSYQTGLALTEAYCD